MPSVYSENNCEARFIDKKIGLLCKCHTRDAHSNACRLHAACMQPATSCMQDAATCNLLHTIVWMHEAAWSLHAGCNLLHAACYNLQPPAYDRIHKKRDNRHNFSSTPTCRASTPALRRRRPSNQSKFYDVALCSLCTFDFLSHSWQSNSFSPVWIRQRTNSYVAFLVTITTGKLFFTEFYDWIWIT